MPKAKQR